MGRHKLLYAHLVGKTFGRLTVIRRGPDTVPYHNAMIECQCSCGGLKTIRIDALRSAQTPSCGCLTREQTALRHRTHGHSSDRRMTPEYAAWHSMRQRCQKPNHPYFKDYGARGITVSPDWNKSFQAFYDHVGPRPSVLHSLDRINNNRGYEPGNVRWAYRQQQSLNTRASLQLLTIDDEPIPLSQVAYRLALTYNTCRNLFRKSGVL